MSNIVTISNNEFWKLERLAHYRNDPKLEKVKNRRYDTSRGDLEINLSGICAEYAVSKFFKEPLDLFIDLGGDGGEFDLIIKDKKAQVKYNNYATGDLYFNSLANFKADIAILVTGTKEKGFKLVGWTDIEYFKNNHKIKNWGYGERLCLEQSQLFNMEELK